MTLLLAATSALVVLGFFPGLFEQFEAPKSAALRILGVAALGASILLVRGVGRRPRLHVLDAAVLAIVAVEILCTLTSRAPVLSLHGDPRQREGLWTAIGLLGVYVSARCSPRGAARAVDTFLVAAALACTYAFLQAARLDPIPWAQTASVGGGLARPFGTLGHPNLLGVVASASAAIALARCGSESRRRWLYAPAAMLYGIACILTFSRGAWFALAGGIGFVCLAWVVGAEQRSRIVSRRRIVVAGMSLTAIVLLLALAGGWRTLVVARGREMLDPSRGSAASRLEIWKAASSAWRDRPLLGHGVDTFALVFPLHQTQRYWQLEWGGLPNHAHSVVLHTLATRGTVGLLAGLFGLLASGWTLWQLRRRTRPLVIETGGAVAAISVAGLFGAFGIAGWVLLALAAARIASASDPPDRATLRRPVLVGALLGGLVVAWPTIQEMRAASATATAKLAISASPAHAVLYARRAVQYAAWDDEMHRYLADAFLAEVNGASNPDSLLEQGHAAAHESLRRSPIRVANWQRLGTIEMARAARGDTAAAARAESAYARSLALSPANTLALLELARGELRLRRLARAQEAALRAAAMLPKDALPHALLGDIANVAGDRATARAAYSRALQLDWHGLERDRAAAVAALQALGPY